MAKKQQFKIRGMDKLKRQLKKMGTSTRLIQEGARALVLAAEGVMNESKRIVPVDTGALRSSGQVKTPRITKRKVIVELGYGDSSVDYATRVHDNVNLRHEPPGQSKFLEKPLLDKQGSIIDRVGGAISVGLKSFGSG